VTKVARSFRFEWSGGAGEFAMRKPRSWSFELLCPLRIDATLTARQFRRVKSLPVPCAQLLIVLMTGLTMVGKAATPPVETVALRESPVIHVDGKNHQVFDGLRIKENDSIVLTQCSDVIISCCDLHSIKLVQCTRVTIRNCWIHDSPNCGVDTYQGRDLRIEGCRLERVASGVYALESRDVEVEGNFARNVQGPYPRGQMTQFNNVMGSKCAVRGNYAINDFGKSHPEDVINIFQSRGEAGGPIVIEDNYLVGDLAKGSQGKSKTGSGIMLGDLGGAYELCRRNVILSAGQAGMGVAGGTYIRVEDNLILGGRSDVSNTGLYAWNQSKKPSHDVTVAHNRVHWTDLHGEETSWWAGGGVGHLQLIENHFADESLATAIPPPPSQAPMPPHPYLATGAGGRSVIRLPWKP